MSNLRCVTLYDSFQFIIIYFASFSRLKPQERNFANQNYSVLWLVGPSTITLLILQAVSDALVPRRTSYSKIAWIFDSSRVSQNISTKCYSKDNNCKFQSIVERIIQYNNLQCTKQKQMPMQNVKDIKCQNSHIRIFELHT